MELEEVNSHNMEHCIGT